MNIKSFLKDYRITQKELSDIFGCAPAHVSNIVNGKRSVTGVQLRLLIEKFGADIISRYAEPGEMPATSVNIDLSTTEINGNHAPVQNGDGNNLQSSDPALVDLLRQQIELNRQQSEHIRNLIDQQNRLISLLEKQNN